MYGDFYLCETQIMSAEKMIASQIKNLQIDGTKDHISLQVLMWSLVRV